MFVFKFLFLIICGVAYRVRGGWIDVGSTTLGRIIYASAYVMACYLINMDLSWWALLLLPLMWLGLTPGWGQVFDIGTRDGDVSEDTYLMAGRGMIMFAMPAIVFSLALDNNMAFWYTLSGLAVGAFYYASWHLIPRFQVGKFIDGPTSLAEILTGAYAPLMFWILN